MKNYLNFFNGGSPKRYYGSAPFCNTMCTVSGPCLITEHRCKGEGQTINSYLKANKMASLYQFKISCLGFKQPQKFHTQVQNCNLFYTWSVEEKYVTEKLFRCLLKRFENIKNIIINLLAFATKILNTFPCAKYKLCCF